MTETTEISRLGFYFFSKQDGLAVPIVTSIIKRLLLYCKKCSCTAAVQSGFGLTFFLIFRQKGSLEPVPASFFLLCLRGGGY